ncbi:MAG: endonuclease III [Verrucomicrobiae bacterium]|nr:endonuclease III [Verrucomicrobiae bacterium]
MPATHAQQKARLKKLIAALRKAHPDARLALNFSNPLELLVALILAAQARDDLVNSVTADLFKKYRTATDWAKLDENDIRRVNFYRNKARAIRAAAQMIAEKFNGHVPDNLDDLLSLPGVGRKTANILLGNAFGQPAIGVDTHVLRLSQRLGLSRNTDPDKVEAELTQLVPPEHSVAFCHLLQFHGRRYCTAKNPNCTACPIAKLCPRIGVAR